MSKYFSSIIISFFIASGVIAQPNNLETSHEKVLSLDLCVDWMLAFYADEKQVSALSPIHPKYPSPLLTQNTSAKHWATHDGSIEGIFKIAPHKVLVSQYNAWVLRNRLMQLGVNVIVFEHPESLDAIETYQQNFLREIGKPETLYVPKPPQKAARTDAARLLVLEANGIGAGINTFEDSVLKYAGWNNYLTEQGHITLDLEKLILDPPEAILFSAPMSKALANQFSEHPALHKVIDAARWIESDYWRWMCPGPWTWDLIEQLHSIQLPPIDR
jgi:iron complex transport system substrate-binding protein